jgi:hypothetical protein
MNIFLILKTCQESLDGNYDYVLGTQESVTFSNINGNIVLSYTQSPK